MSGPNDFEAISQSILAATQDDTVVIAMLVGAGLESTWRIDAAGGGAFQIIDAARPIAPPSWLVFGLGDSQIDLDVKYMLPRYTAAAAAHAKDADNADKFANIAHDAERPAQSYQQSQGETKVQSVYQTVLTNYGGGGVSGGSSQVVQSNPILAFLSPVTGFLTTVTDASLWRSVGWVLLGLALLGLGLLIWLWPTLKRGATTVATLAATKGA